MKDFKKPNSGFLWIGIAILLLLIVVPLIIYGIVKACINGGKWVSQAPDRKLRRLERKTNKLGTKEKIIEFKDKKNARKKALKNPAPKNKTEE